MPSNNARSILYQRIKAISKKRGEPLQVRFTNYNTLKTEFDRLVTLNARDRFRARLELRRLRLERQQQEPREVERVLFYDGMTKQALATIVARYTTNNRRVRLNVSRGEGFEAIQNAQQVFSSADTAISFKDFIKILYST